MTAPKAWNSNWLYRPKAEMGLMMISGVNGTTLKSWAVLNECPKSTGGISDVTEESQTSSKVRTQNLTVEFCTDSSQEPDGHGSYS